MVGGLPSGWRTIEQLEDPRVMGGPPKRGGSTIERGVKRYQKGHVPNVPK